MKPEEPAPEWERQLQTDLHRLAGAAPRAPAATDLFLRLRTRRRKRFGVTVTVAATLVGIVWLGVATLERNADTDRAVRSAPDHDSTAHSTLERIPPPVVLVAQSEPLSADATAAEIRGRLRDFLGASGARHGEIRKSPEAGLSFSFGGETRVPVDQLHEELASFLENYLYADVTITDESVRYSMLVH